MTETNTEPSIGEGLVDVAAAIRDLAAAQAGASEIVLRVPIGLAQILKKNGSSRARVEIPYDMFEPTVAHHCYAAVWLNTQTTEAGPSLVLELEVNNEYRARFVLLPAAEATPAHELEQIRRHR